MCNIFICFLYSSYQANIKSLKFIAINEKKGRKMLKELSLENKTDVELYNKFLNGNKEAFNQIILRYRKVLMSFLYRYVKNVEIAEDLAQDTFLYMYINKKEYDFKYSLKTYLFTVAKCRAINWIKKEKKNVKVEFDEKYMTNNTIIDLDESLIKKEDIKVIYSAMSKLKTEYETIIYLKDFQGMSYKEICKIMNKTMPQVKVLIHRARKSLAKLIKKEGNI